MDDSQTLAVVVARIDDMRGDIAGLRSDLHSRDQALVTRVEFEAWKTGLDRELRDMKTAAESARKEADDRRAPWWTWAAFILSALTLAVVVLPKLGQP